MASGWDNYKKYQDEQKKKKEETKAQSSAAWDNYKSYRAYEDSPEVKLQRNNDYVNNFRQRLSSAYDEYQKTFGNQQYNTQDTFNNFLKKYQNQFSDDSYLKYTRALRELQQAGAISNSDHTDLLKSTPYMSDINKSVKNMADYMANFKNEEEYNKTGRYALKYSGMSDKDLKASADEVMSAYKKATGPEKAALKQEYDWLFNYATGQAGTEIRSARIKDNEQRIAEIEQELKGFIPYQQGKYTKEQLDHYRELERERDTLRAENNKYGRGETYVTDKYGKYAQNADFAATSKQRKFDTSVVNEQEIAARLNPDNWRTSFDGKTYDQYGNEITQEYLDEWRRKGSVQDKLGVYLGASDEDIANAQMTSNNTNGSYDNILNEGRSRYWDLLTESEKDMYYYLLNKEGQQAAYEYLDDLDITLGRRNNEKQIQKYNSLNWLGKVAYNIGTVPASILGGIIGGIDDKINQIQGKDINPYSIAHSASNFASGVREQTAQDLSAKDEYGNRIKFLGLVDFGDVYQAIMSGIDSAVGAAFFGNVGGAFTSYSTAASYGYGLAMGMGAMESEARELFEAGATSQEIFTGSLLAGVAEEVFETVSLDKILHLKDVNSVRDWISNILKSGFIEGSEEFATEITTTLTDMAVRGTQSGAMQSYYNYRDQGISQGQASMRALRDVGITATQAFIGGAISGAAGGFSRGGTQFARYVAPFYGQASSAIKGNNVQGIYDTADQYGVDYSKAQQKVNEFLKEGRGRAGAVSATANVLKNVDRTRTSQNTADMQQKLQEQGISERRAKKIAQTLSDIMERKRADDIEFNRDIDIGAFIGEEDLKVFKGDKNVAIDVLKQAMGGSVANRNFEYEARLEGDKETAEYIKNERIAAAAPKLSFEGTVDGQSSSFTYDHIDGDTLFVKTSDGQVVNADDVQTTNRNAIQVMQDSVLFGDDGARAYLNGYEGGSASDYRQTFTNIYNQAKAGANVETLVSEMVAQGVSEKVARLAAYEGQNAYEAIQSNDVEKIRKYIDRTEAEKIQENVKQAAKGQETDIERENRAALKGVNEDLKKAFTNKRVEVRDADIGSLSQEDQGQLAAVTMMLTALGRKVVIMSNTDSLGNTTLMSGKNGGFDRNSNTYYINTNVMEHAYLNIGLHETVHDISKNQPKIFKQIRDILEKYCKEYKPEALLDQGAEYEKAKNTYPDVTSESELTEIAMEEWVANTVTGIIADPDTFTQFADKFMTESERKTFVNLLDRLLEALKEAFDKIKNVLGWSQIQTVQDDLNLLQQLRDLLFEGYQGIRNDFDIEHQTEQTRENLKNLSELGIEVDSSGAAHFNYSVRTWGHSEAELQKMVDALVTAGFDEEDSKGWVADIDSVYSLVMENQKALSYENDERYSWLKKNSEYSQGSIDFNNNCPKRVEFTALFDRLLKEFPNSVLTDQDFETIRGILKKNNIVVTCGICFVEDRRQKLGTVAQTYIDQLKDGTLAPTFKKLTKGDTYIPTQFDLITYSGFYNLWKNHPGVYESFRRYNNHRGMASIRLVEGIGEYNNQIQKWSWRTINSKNNKGGLRIWSTSDADPRTMLDVMQIVNDAAAKGLQIQGYTKKPWFAKLVKDTGIRLLRSHIPAGIGYETVNGKEVLTVDDVEGINTKDRYYEDVTDNPYIGNNIIGINDHQIRLAMLDPRFDQIIPFHSNQSQSILDKKGIGHYHNYKLEQTEKIGYYSEGKGKVGKQINIYTDVIKEFEKRGKPIKNKRDFVNAYLQVCKERDVCPVFSGFLNKDKNGDYVYTEGFHKFLVDYKMFDKDGNYIPQIAVTPKFDAAFATEVLRNYVRFDEAINRKSDPIASEKAYGEIKDALKDSLRFSTNTERLDQEYMAAVNAKDMVTAQKMVDEAAERAGYVPSNMFHGSMNATFHVFEKSKANPEGNSGAGFYFTTNREDAEQNYADVEGADNFFKTSALAEKIYDDGEWNGLEIEDFDHAKQIAKDLLNKEPGTYEVYLKYDNPYIRDYRNSTDILAKIMDDFDESLVDRNDYDTDEDYEEALMHAREEHIGEAVDRAVYNAYRDIENQYEVIDGPFAGDVVSAIMEEVYNYDTLTWNGIRDALDENLELMVVRDDSVNSEFAATEFTRAIIENFGYDAIYDKEVSTKFNQLNSNGREADHIIVFHPNQIKLSDPVTYDDQGNVIPLSKRFNTNKDDIRFSANIDSEGNKLSEEQQRYFEDSKVRDDEGNLLVMYHGTDAYENFTVFKKGKSGYLGPGIYLSSSKTYADRYASKSGYDGRVYTSYVNITNPLIVTSDNPAIEILGERVARRREEKNSYATTWITNSDIKKLQAKGYDGIIWKYGNTVEVSAWEPNQIKYADNKNPTENPDIRYSAVTDPETIAFLNNQDHVTVYRAMVQINGKLYPPMATKIYNNETGRYELQEPTEIGQWYQSDERPDLVKNGKFNLKKDKGTDVAAAYNPYWHTSLSVLNDQFTSAYKRDNLVVVQGEVPVSELTSGYQAEGAKDPVGRTEWHSGTVSTDLKRAGKNAREVILSRWFKPTNVLTDAEVAQGIAGLVSGTDIEIPFNVVTPGVRTELEKLGVPIGNSRGLREQLDKDIRYSANDDEKKPKVFIRRHYDYSRSWEQQLDDLKQGKIPARDSLIVGPTPEVLQNIGLTALPIVMDQTHVNYHLEGNYPDPSMREDHIFDNEDYKHLPDKIADPIAVIASSTHSGDLVVLVEMKSINGKNGIAAFVVDEDSVQNGKEINAHRIKTLHGRHNAISMLINAIRTENRGAKTVFYINKNKAVSLLTTAGAPALAIPGSRAGSPYVHNITEPGVNVNRKFTDQTETKQFDRWFRNSKAVNKDGTPMILYHYTNAEFDAFDPSLSGTNQGQGLGDGIYLSSSGTDFAYAGKNRLSLYASIQKPFELSRGLSKRQAMYVLNKYGATKHDLHKYNDLYFNHALAKLMEPSRTFDYLKEYAEDNGIKTSDILKDLGYDGIHDGNEWVVFDASQVKSATDNIGLFDTENDKFRYSSNNSIDTSSLNNADENNVVNLKKTIGDQYRLTVGKEMTMPAAEKIARDVTRRVNSQADKAELANRLKALFDKAAKKGKDLDTDSFMDEGTKILRDVLEQSATFDSIRYKADEPLRKYLRETGIALNELQQGEAKYLFDSVANYRRALFGSVLIKNSGVPLDVAWQELNKMSSYLFPSDINDGDMVSYLYDAAKALSKANYYVNEYGFDLDGAAAYEFAQVVGDYTDNKRIKTFVQQLRTYGKRYLENEMKEIRKTRREKMSIQSRLYEEQRKRNVSLKNEIANLNRELSGEAQNIERDITFLQSRLKYAEPGVDELSIREQIADLEQDKANLEARYREEIRNKTAQLQEGQEELEKIGKEYIKAGSTNTSLALDARKAAIGTKSAVKLRAQKEAQEIRTLQNNIRKKSSNLMSRLISGTDTKHVPENLREAVTGFLQAVDLGWNQGTLAAEKWLSDLNVLADKMTAANEVNGNFQVDSMIIDQLREMGARITERLSLAGKNLRTMSIAELNQLDDALSLVNAAIYNSDRLLADDRKQRASAVAERSITEMGKKKQRKHTNDLLGRVGNFFTLDQLDSFSYAERIGGPFKDVIFKNLRKAFDKKVHLVQQGIDAYHKAASVFGNNEKGILSKIRSMSGNNAQTKTFELESGKKLTLNTAQIMELYLLNERDQARVHLYNGGITVEEYKAKDGTVKKQEFIKVTEDDIDRIISTLTKEQKQFANELQKYASSNMSEWGNDVSMTLWGVKKFTEQNYWPITVDDNTTDAVSQDKKNGNVGLYHLKNIGMSKAVNPKANNALVVGDVIDTFIRHVDEMTSYAAYTIPLDDAMKWYNYKNGNQTVQRSIESLMGKGGKAWFTDFIRALNNAQDMTGGMDFADTMIRNAKVAAIAANLRVVIQQPSAFARAIEAIDPKYLLNVSNLNVKQGAKEAQEHSSIARWKNWGFRDVNVGGDLRSLMVGDNSILEQVREKASVLAGVADDATWGALWNACKAEIEDKRKDLEKGSEEYWQAISDRFAEVIDRTQVVDSPFHRSKAMRSKNALWKMYTSFMSEPTKTYNMFYKTISNAYQGNWSAETRKAVARATFAFAAATILNSVLAAIVDVGRDTDDEDWWEKYLKNMGKNMLDGFNPLNLIPIGKDIVSIFDGYEASRMDLDAVSDLIKQLKRAGSTLSGEKDYNVLKIVYDSVMALSKITGIPAGNAWRGINSLLNLTGVDVSAFKGTWNNTNAKAVAEDMYSYFAKGDMAGFQRVFDKYVEDEVSKMVEEDNKTLEETGQHKYDSTESMQNKATKAVLNKLAQQLADNEEQIAEAYLAKTIGDGSEVARIRNEYMAKGIPEEVFDKAVNLYGSSMNVQPEGVNELNSKLYSYDDLYAAIESGDLEDIGYIYDEMIEDSQSMNPEEYISNKAVKEFRDKYYEYVGSGQTAKASQLENTLEQAFGLTSEDLASYKTGYQKYAFVQKAGPDSDDITTAAITTYNTVLKGLGITESTWYDVWKFKNTTHADVDKNGKSIDGSLRDKIFRYIDSLPLSPAQKSALAKECGYGESSIQKNKLW